jgi:enoyl-CoA hydratase
MSTYGIRVERKDKVAVVLFDRPERRNAFDETMWSDLERLTAELARSLPRAVVVSGAGKAFCAGFDVNPDNPQVSSLIGAVEKKERAPVEALIKRLQTAVDGLVSLPVPIIAALNGDAFGGGAELASRCDMRIMDPVARICFSEARLGLMPDWGGGPGLTKLAGASTAADMILTGRRVGAEEALRLGLVNRISAPGQALDEAIALAVIRRVRELPMQQALDLEREQAVSLIVSGECVHGITAFLSKQEPVFPDILPGE